MPVCGRFAFFSSLADIKRLFRIDAVAAEPGTSYNVAPTHAVPAVISHEGRRLGTLHWGLVPSWAHDLSGASKLINARVETLQQKPSFKSLLKHKRCVILADGFYEWQRTGRIRQPYYLAPASGSPFAFAGLWDTWKRPGGTPYHSCTIITTQACPQVRQIHDRMPLVLMPHSVDAWLDAGLRDAAPLADVLLKGHETAFSVRPVSCYVNSPAHNDERCLAEAPAGSR